MPPGAPPTRQLPTAAPRPATDAPLRALVRALARQAAAEAFAAAAISGQDSPDATVTDTPDAPVPD